MNEHLDPEKERFSPEEQDIDRALRPLNFDDFAGPDAI
jgi:Holliday junction DNA helicase RuvB